MVARRVDANQTSIVNAFRKAGASVQILSDVGKGCPDILVGIAGKNYLFEIKDGSKSLSGQALTPAEKEFHKNWRGHVQIIRWVTDLKEFFKELAQTG